MDFARSTRAAKESDSCKDIIIWCPTTLQCYKDLDGRLQNR